VIIQILLTLPVIVAQSTILDDVLKQCIELKFQIAILHKGSRRLEASRHLDKRRANRKGCEMKGTHKLAHADHGLMTVNIYSLTYQNRTQALIFS
jgi:hypothetical protein